MTETRPAPAGEPAMSVADLLRLPAAVSFAKVVPAAFGISRSAAYRALAAGELPFEPIRIGRKLIVRKADLLQALGVTESEPK
jgi:predicted DNA-binding transcriptional regulator AlpA